MRTPCSGHVFVTEPLSTTLNCSDAYGECELCILDYIDEPAVIKFLSFREKHDGFDARRG